MNIFFFYLLRKASDHRNCKVLLPLTAGSGEGAAAWHLPSLSWVWKKKISIMKMETILLW